MVVFVRLNEHSWHLTPVVAPPPSSVTGPLIPAVLGYVDGLVPSEYNNNAVIVKIYLTDKQTYVYDISAINKT